jgi:hypothetical protein
MATISLCKPLGPIIDRSNAETTKTGPLMLKSLLAVILLGVSVTTASAIDLKDLLPCKPAAARYCDHYNRDASMSNLLRCGARLAAVSFRVGARCREVLRRYGQL